jgi:hypothetical protein
MREGMRFNRATLLPLQKAKLLLLRPEIRTETLQDIPWRGSRNRRNRARDS